MSRNWFFTFNNYQDDWQDQWNTAVAAGTIVGAVIGKEIAPTTGTPHLQGVVFMPGAIRMGTTPRTGLRKLFGPGFHWEPCRKRKKAIIYCRKEGDSYDFGKVESTQGERSDLAIGAEELLLHRSITQFKLDNPVLWIKYSKGFSSLLTVPPRPMEIKPVVTWIYGPTGTGKTRSVIFKEPDLWVSGFNLNWFDGYIGQPAVLFDDFRGSFCSFQTLLRLTDRYVFPVPVKGGFVDWAPLRIYITSCLHPKDAYPNCDEKVDQLLRRIDTILHIPFEVTPTAPAE